MPSRAIYYYGTKSHPQGPVTDEWLQTLLGRRMIGPLTRVWAEGMPEVSASELPFLQSVLRGEVPVDHSLGPTALQRGPWSKWALLAAVCWLISIGWFVAAWFVPVPSLVGQVAVFSIPFGLVGWAEIRRHPHKRGKWLAIGSAAVGIALIVIVTVRDFMR